MPAYDYPVSHDKIVVLLSASLDEGEFRSWYLECHARKVASLPMVSEYLANIVKTDEVQSLTSSTNGNDPYGVSAVDEIKGACWNDIAGLYEKAEIIGAYRVTEYMIRELHTDRPVGIRSPEIKRIAMLAKPVDRTHDQAMQYWLEKHPSFCFRHHTGMAKYSQNHVDELLTHDTKPLDGFPILYYWNADAFKYGHFSMKDTAELMMEDCRHFRSTSFVINVDEYVMKK